MRATATPCSNGCGSPTIADSVPIASRDNSSSSCDGRAEILDALSSRRAISAMGRAPVILAAIRIGSSSFAASVTDDTGCKIPALTKWSASSWDKPDDQANAISGSRRSRSRQFRTNRSHLCWPVVTNLSAILSPTFVRAAIAEPIAILIGLFPLSNRRYSPCLKSHNAGRLNCPPKARARLWASSNAATASAWIMACASGKPPQ